MTPIGPEITPKYNILTLDGGNIRGLIPVMVVDYLEKYAYEYGTTNGYLKTEDFPEQRYPTFKMFDMLSATSTSSVLAAAISVPS